jgi:hypothetical protein
MLSQLSVQADQLIIPGDRGIDLAGDGREGRQGGAGVGVGAAGPEGGQWRGGSGIGLGVVAESAVLEL